MADNKSSMSVVWQACRGWRGAPGEGGRGGQLSECWLEAKCIRSLTSNAVLCGKFKCCKMPVKVCVCAYGCVCVSPCMDMFIKSERHFAAVYHAITSAKRCQAALRNTCKRLARYTDINRYICTWRYLY